MKSRRKGFSKNRCDFHKLYQHTPMMMHSIDIEGRLVAVSDQWLEALGYTRDEVIGRKLTDFFADNSKDLAEDTVLPYFFDVGWVKDIPYERVKKNGETMDVLISAKSERDEHGNILYSMAGIVDVTERKKADQEVQHLAHYDALTGQPNRILLQERLQHALIRAQRDNDKVGVLFVDLDRFKWVNDTLGHACGDELLKDVAKRMQDCVRQEDTVARFGGDEFVIILYGFSGDEKPPHFAQRFLDALSKPITLEGVEMKNSASIGIAIYPMDGKDVDTLLRNADMAMYSAKEHGRNNYRFFSGEMNEKVLVKLGMENRLRRAINNREFYLVYQPQFDLLAKRITGFEALLRWDDPEYGPVPPTDFIPVAEKCGVIYQLGEWVLQTACEQAKGLQKKGYQGLRMAVNVSSTQFLRHDFIDMVEEMLRRSDLDPEFLEIELTETLVMENLQQGIDRLTDLKVRDIKLAIDDFGTGYSSLQYLKHFPFDRIKIAQEFVKEIPGNSEDLAIVEAVLAIARTLKLDVIAEGVETSGQLEYFSSSYCNEIQGYFFARPYKPEHLSTLLNADYSRLGEASFPEQFNLIN